jgi:hypothetical protein
MVMCFCEGIIKPDSFNNLETVTALFMPPWGMFTGWAHLLVFDALAGRWMTSRAPHAGYRLSPILVVTFLVAPLGLMLFAAFEKLLVAERA